MDWDSDLFYIQDFGTYKIGNISGNGCDNRIQKDGIYIHKIQKGKASLIQTLPIQTTEKYKDGKWGFIEDYWTNHYKRFAG